MSALIALTAPLVLGAQAELARVHALALEAGREADGAALADLDGDGANEVLLAVHESGRDFARHLETWRIGSAGKPERVASLALTRDVVAFAHGDVLAGGGEELVLFNAGGVFAMPGGAEARPVRLLAVELLWQAPGPRSVFEWPHGIRDLDGDGLADLVVPEPDGFALAVQRRSAEPDAPFGLVSRVRVPREAPAPGERERERRRGRGSASARGGDGSFSLALRLGTDEEDDVGPLVRVEERVPAPAWLDWDADGDLDLLVQTRTALHVWPQDAGRFDEAPRLSLALPVVADRSRELDASYSAHAVDLDGDGRADYAVFAGDKASEDVRTQGLFFAQAGSDGNGGAPLFGAEGTPSSLLVFAGFLSDPDFRDLDGDGYPELVVRTFRPDLIDQIKSAASRTIDLELFVYRNRAGTLARRPDLAKRFAVALDEGELELEFLGDVTGDGMSELLVRDAPDSVRVLMLRAGRDGALGLVEKPLWELRIASGASVEVVRGARGPTLFVLEPAQVLVASFE